MRTVWNGWFRAPFSICSSECGGMSTAEMTVTYSSDEILRHAEKKAAPNPNAPAATAPAPAATGYRPIAAPVQRTMAGSTRAPLSAGIASTGAPASHPASNLAQTYRNNPPPMRGGPPLQGGSRSFPGQQPMQPAPGGFDPRSMRGTPPPQQGYPQGQPPARNGYAAAGRRF